MERINNATLLMKPDQEYKKKAEVVDDNSTPDARAERLRRIRNMANLSRVDMCDDNSININTYKGWEIARYGGLPKDGAERVVSRVAKESVFCTKEWLLFGTGIGPYVQTDINLSKDLNDTHLNTELEYFHQHHPNAIHCEIKDDGMSPTYVAGDIVAGVQHYGEQINNFLEQTCIAQLTTGEVITRLLKKGRKQNTYMLACSNLNTTVAKPVLYDVELVSVASIKRLYR